MAIVKFVSDKDCVVFIDMELAGKVAPDSMLKVTLESGGYLIQIKDDDGHLIKEYDLEIKASDNQVLQKINESNCQIEGVIRNLRNDSSLRFYHQRAIFCYNGNYGYINSQYKIAIDPVYSYVENFTNLKALVKKVFPDGEKANIIDLNGNICLDRWFDYIGSGEKTILLKSEKVFYVLSKVDYSIVNQYIDAKYNGKGELIPVHKNIGVDDMYGYIDKTGTEAIPFIYDYVWNFEDNGFAKVKRFGFVNSVDKNGTLFYNLEQAIMDGTTYRREKGWLDEPGETDIIEVYKACKLSKDECIKKGFGYLFTPIKEGGNWVLYSFGLDDYLRVNDEIVKCERLFYYDDYYIAYRTEGVCKFVIFNNNNDIAYSFNADEIFVNFKTEQAGYAGNDKKSINNLIIKKNKKYGIVNLAGEIILPIEYDLIEPTEVVQGNVEGNMGIIWKEDKCSFIWMSNGEILEPFKYDDIIVNSASGHTWLMNSTFLVKEQGKYGCVDFNRKHILPSIYDSIDFNLEIDCYGYHYKMLLYKDGKVGTYEYCNYRSELKNYVVIETVFSIDPEYDECVFLKHKDSVTSFTGMSYVAVKKDNKWGIIDNKPAGLNYYYDFDDHWRNNPNLKDLDFKYNSLEELKDDADNEFERRHDKYINRHRFDW